MLVQCFLEYMPIFIEIAPRTFKISRFESNIPKNENHKFTIFHLCTSTTITSSVNGGTFSVINNSDLD